MPVPSLLARAVDYKIIFKKKQKTVVNSKVARHLGGLGMGAVICVLHVT